MRYELDTNKACRKINDGTMKPTDDDNGLRSMLNVYGQYKQPFHLLFAEDVL
jgi:hypothetical protein